LIKLHPLDWSLRSIYYRLLGYGHTTLLNPRDIVNYTPPFSIEGRVVLDVGAFCGDSALFFFKLGVRRVICIEPYFSDLLRATVEKRKLNVEIVPEKFRLDHLSKYHDFCKVDIEGYEEAILDVDPRRLKPTIIEVHGRQLLDKFLARGWTLQDQEPAYQCTAYVQNYNLARR